MSLWATGAPGLPFRRYTFSLSRRSWCSCSASRLPSGLPPGYPSFAVQLVWRFALGLALALLSRLFSYLARRGSVFAPRPPCVSVGCRLGAPLCAFLSGASLFLLGRGSGRACILPLPVLRRAPSYSCSPAVELLGLLLTAGQPTSSSWIPLLSPSAPAPSCIFRVGQHSAAPIPPGPIPSPPVGVRSRPFCTRDSAQFSPFTLLFFPLHAGATPSGAYPCAARFLLPRRLAPGCLPRLRCCLSVFYRSPAAVPGGLRCWRGRYYFSPVCSCSPSSSAPPWFAPAGGGAATFRLAPGSVMLAISLRCLAFPLLHRPPASPFGDFLWFGPIDPHFRALRVIPPCHFRSGLLLFTFGFSAASLAPLSKLALARCPFRLLCSALSQPLPSPPHPSLPFGPLSPSSSLDLARFFFTRPTPGLFLLVSATIFLFLVGPHRTLPLARALLFDCTAGSHLP